jgi:hypothetical protein
MTLTRHGAGYIITASHFMQVRFARFAIKIFVLPLDVF